MSRKRYRYTGKEKDEETGLYYHGARYYAPWLGRWTSADPIGLGDGANRWSYVGARPTAMLDPTGTSGDPATAGEERLPDKEVISSKFSEAPMPSEGSAVFFTERGRILRQELSRSELVEAEFAHQPLLDVYTTWHELGSSSETAVSPTATIRLAPGQSLPETAIDFAHEVSHRSDMEENLDLKERAREGTISRREFVTRKLEQEFAAWEFEVRVAQELGYTDSDVPEAAEKHRVTQAIMEREQVLQKQLAGATSHRGRAGAERQLARLQREKVRTVGEAVHRRRIPIERHTTEGGKHTRDRTVTVTGRERYSKLYRMYRSGKLE